MCLSVTFTHCRCSVKILLTNSKNIATLSLLIFRKKSTDPPSGSPDDLNIVICCWYESTRSHSGTINWCQIVVKYHWPNNIHARTREHTLLKLTSVEMILSKLQKDSFTVCTLQRKLKIISSLTSNDRGHALFLLCLPSWPFLWLNMYEIVIRQDRQGPEHLVRVKACE